MGSPLVSFRNSVLYPTDVLALLPGNWIGDASIAFFLDHLGASAPPRALLLPPSTACILLNEADPAELKADLAGLPLSTAEFILFPVIDGSLDVAAAGSGSHWSLLRWRRGAGFSHVNPLGRGGSNLANARLIAAHVHPLLADAGGRGAEVAEAPSVEAQAGSCDCGAHLLQNAEAALAAFAGGGGGGGGAAAAATAPASDYRRRAWELAAAMPFDDAARAWFAARPFPR